MISAATESLPGASHRSGCQRSAQAGKAPALPTYHLSSALADDTALLS